MTTIKQNIVANYLGQAWSGFIAIAFLPLYVKYLGMEAYGLIGLFAVVQALVMILDLGMSHTINREMASFVNGGYSPQSIRNLLRSVEIICYGIAIAVVIVAWLFSDYFAREWLKVDRLPVGDVAYALTLMTFVAALRLCEGVYRGALYGLEQQVWYNCIYSFFLILRYVGVLAILAWFSATVGAFFVWQAGVSLLTLLVLAMRVHKSLPKSFSKAKFSQASLIKVWKFAGGMMGITFLTMLFLQLDKVLLSRLISLKSLGYYLLAATAANIMFMVVVPVTQAVYPQFVKLSSCDDQSKMETIYHETTQLVTIMIASTGMLLCFFSEGVVFMWSGDHELMKNLAPLISILVIGSILNSLSYLPYQLQIAHGWTSLLLKVNVLLVLVLIPAIMIIAPIYGVMGAAWVWVALNALYLLLMTHFMHRRLLPDQKWKWLYFDLLFPACGAVIVMALAKQMQPQDYVDRLHWFLFLLLTGVMAVLVSTIITSSGRGKLLMLLRAYK